MFNSKWISVVLIVLVFSGCGYREFEIQNEGELLPSKIHVYLDCSGSMQGFFRTSRNSSVIDLIGNMNTDFVQNDVKVVFHKFDNQTALVSEGFEVFSDSALTSSFYNCGNNLYSVPLREIAHAMDSLPNELHLVLTDGVVSTDNPSREKSKLLDVLAKFSKSDNSNISLYQYSFGFDGLYYPQPPRPGNYNHELSVRTGPVNRNFYTIALGNARYKSFLDGIFLEDNHADNSEHFNSYEEEKVRIERVCDSRYVVDGTFYLKAWITDELASNDAFLNSFYSISIDKESLIDLNPLGAGEYLMEVSLPKSGEIENLKIINKYDQIDSSKWWSLDYDIEREPSDAGLIDHSKTFQLDVLVKAFSNIYRDEPSYKQSIIIKKADHSSLFSGLYTFILGQQKEGFWLTTNIYAKLSLTSIVLSLIIAVTFFKSGWFDFKPDPMRWYKGLLAGCLFVVFALSVLFIYGGYTLCPDLPFRLSTVLGHAGVTMFYAFAVYLITSLSIKHTNPNLNIF